MRRRPISRFLNIQKLESFSFFECSIGIYYFLNVYFVDSDCVSVFWKRYIEAVFDLNFTTNLTCIFIHNRLTLW